MKTYTFELVVKEGNDEFWDDISSVGGNGCDEVEEAIERALAAHGFLSGENEDVSLKLISFSNRSSN